MKHSKFLPLDAKYNVPELKKKQKDVKYYDRAKYAVLLAFSLQFNKFVDQFRYISFKLVFWFRQACWRKFKTPVLACFVLFRKPLSKVGLFGWIFPDCILLFIHYRNDPIQFGGKKVKTSCSWSHCKEANWASFIVISSEMLNSNKTNGLVGSSIPRSQGSKWQYIKFIHQIVRLAAYDGKYLHLTTFVPTKIFFIAVCMCQHRTTLQVWERC